MAHEKILVVEDEGIVALNIKKIIEKYGYTLAGIATSGEDAIAQAVKDRPDLVLMDISLNGAIDGVDAAEKVRSLFRIPVIFLTAHTDERTLKRAKQAEPFGYIVKPFRERDLNISIEFALYKAKAEEKIRQLNEGLQCRARELELANRNMESFSSAASHDLRSPLISMEGFSRILAEDYAERLDDKGKDLINKLNEKAKQMTRLIEDLLAFSRLSTAEVRKAKIDMEGLAKTVFAELRTDERNITFEIKALPYSCGDLSMIRQVLVNLLSNAIKFTRSKDTAIIEIGGDTGNAENVYYVRDNGCGFDMRFVDKLFGLFQRIPVLKEIEGTGIGLFIVKNIIEKHGGRVWAEGKPSEGAIFYFALPTNSCRQLT